jgi:hypothetical protein
MTAGEAYDCDLDFRMLVDAWVEERRCPLALVDRALELGMESQAECARWAATEPERNGGSEFKRKKSPPYPTEAAKWYWFSMPRNGIGDECWNIPRENFRKEVHYNTNQFDSPLDAILWLLDNWRTGQ